MSMRMMDNPLHKSSKSTGKKLSESALSELWKLTKGLYHQSREHLLKKNGGISVRTESFVMF